MKHKKIIESAIKKSFIAALLLILALKIVYAPPEDDFNANPTPENFDKLPNPTASDLAKLAEPALEQFKKLPINERRIYLITTNLDKPYERDFADEYLKKLGVINSPENAPIANKYFSKIGKIPVVNLALGSLELDGSILKNGNFKLDFESIKYFQGIESMVSTPDGIILKFAGGKEISVGGNNYQQPFSLKQLNGEDYMLINSQDYKIPKNAKLDVDFKDGKYTSISNKGSLDVRLVINKDVDSRAFYPSEELFASKQPTVTAILESIELKPAGSATLNMPFVIQNGDITFRLERNLLTGEYYGLREVVQANNNPVRVEISNVAETRRLISLNNLEENKRAVYLFHPSAWSGIEEINGVQGKNLEEVFKLRSGALVVGGEITYLAAEIDKNKEEIRGIVYTSSMNSEKHQNNLYFRDGIERELLVTEANGNKAIFTIASDKNELKETPFAISLIAFDKNNFRQLNIMSDDGEIVTSESREGYSNLEETELSYTINLPKIEEKIPQSGKAISVSSGPLKIEDGRLYQGDSILNVGLDKNGDFIIGGDGRARVDFAGHSFEFPQPASLGIEETKITLKEPVKFRITTGGGEVYDITLPSGTFDLAKENNIPVSIEREGVAVLENANLKLIPPQNVGETTTIYFEGDVKLLNALAKLGPIGLPVKVSNIATNGAGRALENIPIIGPFLSKLVEIGSGNSMKVPVNYKIAGPN